MSPRRPSDLAYEVEVDDVQSIALGGYGKLPAAGYLLFGFDGNTAAATAWLAALSGHLTTGPEDSDAETLVNVALSKNGLAVLDLEPRALEEFGTAFRQGMSGSPHRSWDLGDVADNASNSWQWGAATPVDAVLVLYARDVPQRDALITTHQRLAASHGVTTVVEPLQSEWPNPAEAREHFGFIDGISQPEFRLRGILGREDEQRMASGTLLAPGELLLGYPNEADQWPLTPTVASTPAARAAGLATAGDGRCDLGRNGSYLVFRQIAQNVGAFWQFADAHASPPGTLQRCGAKMIGRWPNGAPLTLFPDAQPAVVEKEALNGFGFADADAEGLRCPIGAHIRRANPRDTLSEMAERRSLAAVRRHRILRRGRPFGPKFEGWPHPEAMRDAHLAAGAAPASQRLDAAEADWKPVRGMYFLCLNADIEQQFEFVQQRWLNDPTFVGRNDEVDPILGRQRDGAGFVVPTPGGRETLGNAAVPLRRFTRVIGGEYFFLPSRRAVHYLTGRRPDARLTPSERRR